LFRKQRNKASADIFYYRSNVYEQQTYFNLLAKESNGNTAKRIIAIYIRKSLIILILIELKKKEKSYVTNVLLLSIFSIKIRISI